MRYFTKELVNYFKLFDTMIQTMWWMKWKQLIMWLQLRLDWLICTFYAALALMLIFLSDNETFSEVSLTHTVCKWPLASLIQYDSDGCSFAWSCFSGDSGVEIILAVQSDASTYWIDSFKSIFVAWRISILYQRFLSCWKSLNFIWKNSGILPITRWNEPEETERK